MITGQIVWYAPVRGEGRELKVTNVGRKWATLETLPYLVNGGHGMLSTAREFGRCNKDTGWADTGNRGGGGGRCWPSEQAYKHHVDITGAWNAYRLRVMGMVQPPPGLQLVEIQGMLEKL